MKKLLALSCAAVVALSASSAALAKNYVGKTFPNFTAKDAITGEDIDLSDLKGKVVLLDFWATWCGPCIQFMPKVHEAQEKFGDKGLVLISISLDDNKDKFEKYVTDHKMTWGHVMDGGGWKAALAKKYEINSIPALFLIDQEGKCVADVSSLRKGDALNREIEKLLDTTPKEPVITREMQREADGEKALADADAIRDAKKYRDAVDAYEAITKNHRGTKSADAAEARIKDMKSDKVIGKAMMEAEAAEKGPKLLDLARQLADNNKEASARRYYKRIIKEYPGTEVAATAAEELKDMGE